jgi:hypothetical protein
LSLDEEGIISLLKRYDKDSKAIKEDILRMCWYMRGSISYDDAMLLSEQERKIIGKIIEDNLETVKKTGLPFF